MKFVIAALAGIAAAVSEDPQNHWAVIMAGSNTYSNYRHQADTHHAVKIMLENGIPRDQIIHLAYDDIASSRSNPFPGQLFNKPTDAGVAGVNVYDQSEIDYSGAEVTKENFFKVLLGDTSASGPVLGSDSNSRVFVNFVDHGGAGLICTPEGSADWIYADELDSTLQTMKDTGMFGELVFYLEACESGSMFPNLTDSENIFATTATNATSSSWGAYCGSEAYVDGTNIGSCLGDLYSINWMENTDSADVTTETIAEQWNTVTQLTTRSPVQQFGTTAFDGEPIGNFQGDYDVLPAGFLERTMAKAVHFADKYFHPEAGSKVHVDSRDIKFNDLYQMVLHDPSAENYAALEAEIAHRQFADDLFNTHFPASGDFDGHPKDFDCLRQMLGQIEEMCGDFSSYSLKYVKHVAEHCDNKSAEELAVVATNVFAQCNTQ